MGTLLRVRSSRRRAFRRVRRPSRCRGVPGSREGSDVADRIQPREHELLHRLDQERAVPGHPGRRGVRGLSATLPDLEAATAQEVVAYGVEHYHPRLTLACSFQKEESVLFHMLSELAEGRPPLRAFTIDTGVLFPETLATWKQFEERYPQITIDVMD